MALLLFLNVVVFVPGGRGMVVLLACGRGGVGVGEWGLGHANQVGEL